MNSKIYPDFTEYISRFFGLEKKIDPLDFDIFIVELARVKLYTLKKKKPISSDDKVSISGFYLMNTGEIMKASLQGGYVKIILRYSTIKFPYAWLKNPNKALKEYTDWAEKFNNLREKNKNG